MISAEKCGITGIINFAASSKCAFLRLLINSRIFIQIRNKVNLGIFTNVVIPMWFTEKQSVVFFAL